MHDHSPNYRCCHNQKLIHTDIDIVCSTCGRVSDKIVENLDTAPVSKSKVIPCDENRIGSAEISPPSILHSQRHRNILESRSNPYEKKLFDACNTLSIPQTHCRRILYLFRTILRIKKIALGAAAFFSIYQTCKENHIDIADYTITTKVQECFSLKRQIKPKKAIFLAKSVLLDSPKEIHLDEAYSLSDAQCLKSIKSEPLRRIIMRLSANYNSPKTVVDIVKHMDVDDP